ncbi:MAG TPA: 6-phosphofructokinase [Balneolaceae bacterium]|nr:6-phosphofructokinase [Balneolaceae bacterium]
MANINKIKGVIGILTGGGDVPGLNPAIRGVTVRAIREGYKVIGIRRGWGGLIDVVRDENADNSKNYFELTEEVVTKAARTGGTFLHTSRTNPSKVSKADMPDQYKDKYTDDINDLTEEVLKNLDFMGIDTMIPIGGDDTLSYGVRLHKEGFNVVAIPKTMDNDVPGTDYCIGFSTCISRTIQLANDLRTPTGSHERFLVMEVFGRYAGFTAMLPTLAGASHRCLIPEHKFDLEQLTEIMVEDRRKNSSNYSSVMISEGAMIEGRDMIFEGDEADAFGHKKLGGIGDVVSAEIKKRSAKYNNGREIGTINQKLGYTIRGGNPDAIDSIAPMAFGNIALDHVMKGEFGKLVVLNNGKYGSMGIEIVTSTSKVVDVDKYYNTERYRPFYNVFDGQPLFIMASQISH